MAGADTSAHTSQTHSAQITRICAFTIGLHRLACGIRLGGSRAASNVTLGVSGGWSAWPEYGQAEMYRLADGLSGSSGNVGRNNVGGVPVQRGAGPVIAHRGARISVGRGFLDIPAAAPRHPARR